MLRAARLWRARSPDEMARVIRQPLVEVLLAEAGQHLEGMLERSAVVDLYGSLLAKALFPAFEAARGRPTVALLQFLQTTEHWSADQLQDLQLGLLRRLLRHAYQHTAHFREVFDERGLRPEDIQSVRRARPATRRHPDLR
jgi:hypothetical protein